MVMKNENLFLVTTEYWIEKSFANTKNLTFFAFVCLFSGITLAATMKPCK